MDGYMGKILRVNLTDRSWKEEALNPKIARDYIGGTGLGNRIIYDEVPPSTDPLSPANKIVFATGPVTATNYPSGARYQICFKSPLTGILCDSSSGGYWGGDLKRAGYDALIVEGASSAPVYLWIHNGKVEFKSAAHLYSPRQSNSGTIRVGRHFYGSCRRVLWQWKHRCDNLHAAGFGCFNA